MNSVVLIMVYYNKYVVFLRIIRVPLLLYWVACTAQDFRRQNQRMCVLGGRRADVL